MDAMKKPSDSFNQLRVIPGGYVDGSDATTIDRTPAVVFNTIERTTPLARLTDNWNSYNALQPKYEAINGAIYLASRLFVEDLPEPDVMPVPNGNVQLEWSCHDMYLEMEVQSKHRVEVFYEDLRTQTQLEFVITHDFTKLSDALAELASRSRKTRLQVAR